MKSIQFLLSISLLFLQTFASSQTLINSSFEEYTNGSVFGQDDWLEDNDNDGAAEIIANSIYAHTGSKGLKIYSTAAVETVIDYQSYGKDETGLSSNVYFDLWVKIVSVPSDESVFIRVFDHLPDNGIRRAAELRLLPDGGIGVNGSSSADAQHTLGDWLRLSIGVDYATATYEVAINGAVLDEVFNFRESYNPIDKDRPSGIKEYHGLRFWYENAIADVAVDDLYIGTDPIDDIAFTPPTNDRTIAVTQPDKASISLNPQKEIYQEGETVIATVSNIANHYKFNGWTGSLSGMDNPNTFQVAGNMSFGADIIIDDQDPPNNYTVTINQPTGGTITVDPTVGPYYEGETVEFEVTPAIGYEFDSWIGISGTDPSIEVVISQDLTVSANMILGNFTKRTVNVSTKDELENAVENMLPGDSIVLADGTYIEFNESMINQGGTTDFPVYIIAANRGMARITGKSNFRMDNCAYINIMGLDIDIDDKNNIFKLTDCNNIRISRNTVTSSNTADESSKWIEIQGVWDAEVTTSHHNRVDHNLFEGKMDAGALFIIGGNSGENDPSISTYDRIDHNHFKNVGPRVNNEKETIRVGYSKLSLASSYTTIEYNLFEECDGDPEIISVKSCDNYVRNNTFLRSLGTVSLRHGNRTEVSGNYFVGDDKTAEFEGSTIGCGGVRVYGKDHKIFNNYFEGLTGYRWDAACTLTGGDASNDNVTQDSDLAKHYRIENLEFTHNTLVNNFSDIEIGYRDDWKLDPKNVLIANNIIVQDKNKVTTVHEAGRESDVAFADNIIYTTGSGSFGDINFTSVQAANVDPLLEKSNCLVPESGCEEAFPNAIYKISSASSPAVNPSPANTIAEVTIDVEGQPSVGVRDIGADEYNATAEITNGRLDERHVGPNAEPFSETSSNEYTIQLQQSTGGTIAVAPSADSYANGSQVTFTAVPDEGYSFSKWVGIDGTEPEVQIVVTSDLTVSADFILGDQEVLSTTNKSIGIYPNPTQGLIRIGGAESLGNYRIFNLSGKVLKSGVITDNQVEIASLKSGVYLLEVYNAEVTRHLKFIKK